MKYLFTLVALCQLIWGHAQVGINLNGDSPNPHAGLDVDFSDKGFLLPRISEEQRDGMSNPPAGLMIYNTTSQCLEVRMPLGWREIECNCSSYPSAALTQPFSVSVNSDATFSASASGETYAWTFAGAVPSTSTLQNPTVQWSSGGTYTVELTVTNALGCAATTSQTVEVSSFPPSSPSLVCESGYNITAAPQTGYLGCVTLTYRNNQVTYTTVRAADGKEWLRQDLGSSSVGSYGDLFQWGRWDDGHQLRSPAFTTNTPASPNSPDAYAGNPNGPNPFHWSASAGSRWWAGGSTSNTWTAASPAEISSTNGMDPCKQLLGGTWHVPSAGPASEWTTAFTAENITNGTTAQNSNLRLTMGGFRYSENQDLWAVNQSGYYWGSTPHASVSGRARNVVFWSGGMLTDITEERGYGYSIRCVR